MIEEIEICNYKSITDLKFEPGRVNVLVGANGSGKSNILEAISFGAAAANDKLDNEFLASRGIRVSADPRFMRAAFDKKDVNAPILLKFCDHIDAQYAYKLQKANDEPYSSWEMKPEYVLPTSDPYHPQRTHYLHQAGRLQLQPYYGPESLNTYKSYSPESSALRKFEEEGQIFPLGIRGEGLFKLISVMGDSLRDEVKQRLELLDWFEGFDPSNEGVFTERSLRIRDRYLDVDLAYFDQKSANEGFLFLLFYFCLFISDWTPSFFAIDNIEASLNPKLCIRLMTELASLAKKKGKQVILTTHNPAVLDGLDLTDDEQRLFAVSRNRSGHTRIRRILAPQPTTDKPPVRLSEAFMRGYLGGLPDNF